MGWSDRGNGAVEIEFLAPNDHAFGPGGPADFVGFDGDDDAFGDEAPPRSRWLSFVAGTVVLALLGAGVVAAAPWDDGAASPTPTDVPTPTTVATPDSSERTGDDGIPTRREPWPVEPEGFVVDAAAGLQFGGAWSNPSAVVTLGPDHVEVWASPLAGRTSGRWLAIGSLVEQRFGPEEIRPGAVRIEVDDRPTLVTTDVDGVVHLFGTTLEGDSIEVSGYGYELAELIAVVAGIGVDGGAFRYERLDPGLLAGMSSVLSRAVYYGGLGSSLLSVPEASSYWADAAGTGWVEVARRPVSPADDLLAELLLPHIATILVPGGEAVVHAVPGAPMGYLVRWADPSGVAVWVTTQAIALADLPDIVAGVRLARTDEWVEFVTDGQDGVSIDGDESAAPEMIGSGRSGRGDSWSMHFAAESRMLYISTDRSGWGGAIGDLPTEGTVHPFSSVSATYLLLTAEWPSEHLTARITVEGDDPVDVVLVPLAGGVVYAAGYAVPADRPYTVEFV